MRVIDRHENESLLINRRTEVKVLEIRDDCVRLAIVSPDDDVPYREQTVYFAGTAGERQLQLN